MQSGSAGRQRQYRVLVAEDVRGIAESFAAALREAGYDVECVEDGVACLERVHAAGTAFDLLVLDILMPRMGGVEVMRRLREQGSTVGFVVCTAKSFKTEQDRVSELGAFAMMAKPFPPSLLVQIVDDYFAQHGTTGTNGGRNGGAPHIVRGATTGDVFHPRLESHRGCFTLWGTRGSVPTPGAQFLRHGGQTSCMQVKLGDDLVVLDAGSGIRNLGLELAQQPPCRVHLFITHTHWDHIQGFPFFKPAYLPGFEIVVYGAETFGKDLRGIFSGQLDRDYFPVQIGDMKARLEFRQLKEGPVSAGPLKVWWEYAHHPGATVGYKVNVLGRKLAWFPDNEFLNGYLGPPEAVTRDHELVAPYSRLIDFLADVDVLVHEAQYTNDEYPEKVGWGHSSVSNVCVLAKLARARRWIVTHHDPLHEDAFLETKLNLTRQLLARVGHPIPVTHGYDGLTEYL